MRTSIPGWFRLVVALVLLGGVALFDLVVRREQAPPRADVPDDSLGGLFRGYIEKELSEEDQLNEKQGAEEEAEED